MDVEDAVTLQLPFAFAKKHGVVLCISDNKQAQVSYKNQLSCRVIAELTRYVGRPLTFQSVEAAHFEQMLAHAYDRSSASAREESQRFSDEFNLSDLINELPNSEDLLEQQDDAPVIRLLNALLTEAIKRSASDVHLETFEERLLIRFRIDGVLHEVQTLQKMLAPVLVSRVKVMAKLDIAEKRMPQDGRISLKIAGRAVDVRVSVMPTHFGERVVMRLLDKGAVKLAFANLGLPQGLAKKISTLIHKPHGILLVTGPTGSGKSTTLYAGLTELNQTSRNILTIEDPIEYYLSGVGQTQVNSKVGLSFAKGLRAILRQDPDVVMVGEIRDVETAKVAVQSSLTGHLVMSTLHTNSAIGAITRLADMGVEPFLLSSSLIGVLAQRLVRLLCVHCKRPTNASQANLELLGQAVATTIFESVGCAHCHNTGYHKRTGIYHLVEIDEHLQEMIHSGAGEPAMKTYCDAGDNGLRKAGFDCVIAGLTSLDEILRITSEM